MIDQIEDDQQSKQMLRTIIDDELATINKWLQEPRALLSTTPEVSDYDGQAELWFDSVEEMNAAFNEPRFLAEVHPDDATFIDMEGCKLMVVQEIPKVA